MLGRKSPGYVDGKLIALRHSSGAMTKWKRGRAEKVATHKLGRGGIQRDPC